MAEERVIIEVELDQKAAEKKAESLEREILKLRERQRELNKQFKAGEITQEQYAKAKLATSTAIKKASKDQREALKVTQAESGSINALRAKLAQLTTQRNKTNQTTKEGVERAKELDAEILSLNNRLKANEQAGGDFRRNVGNYTQSIIDAADATEVFGINLGQARGVITTVNAGISSTETRLKGLKVALASTGIGAILVLLGTLVSYFQNTQRGADKFNQALAAINTTFDVLIDRASLFGEGIYQLFTGNFQQALETFRNSVSGIGDEIANEANRAFQLEKDRQQLERAEINFIREKAKLQRELESLRTQGEDRSRSAVEREQALTQALEIQNRLTERTTALQKERVRILEQQQALGENMIEDDRQLAEQQAELDRIQAEAQERFRTINNQLNATRLEMAKGAENEIMNLRINSEIQTLQSIRNLEEEFYADPASSAPVRAAEAIKQLRIRAAQEEASAKANIQQAEQQIAQQTEVNKRNAAAETANIVKGLAEEGTAVQKGASIASTLASAYSGATAALSPPPVGAGPIIGIPIAAATVAKGLINAGKIAKLKRGGRIKGPGTETSDSVPIMASKNEVMINANSAKMFAPLLDAINQAGGGVPITTPNYSGGYAQGGIIQAQRNVSDRMGIEDLNNTISQMNFYVSVTEVEQKLNRKSKKVQETSV